MSPSGNVSDEKEAVQHQEKLKVETSKIENVDPDLVQFFDTFAAKDEEWRMQMTRKLLRKVDLRLILPLLLMYLLNFLDRSNLAQARVGTLESDLNMTGSDFNLATSILFVGYLTAQLPSNMLITKVRPSLYLGLVMMVWGVVSTCNAAVHSLGGLLAVRVMLGIAEAPFFPGAILLMSSWYTRGELTFRISWLYSGNALANMFGGLIAAGVLGNLEGSLGIAGWRWLFIIEGTITIAFAIVFIFVLPNFPDTTMWLSEEERAFAQWRLSIDANEKDDKNFSTRQGLKMALKDYRLYIFIVLQHASIVSQTFQYFFPTIVRTLGYGPIETLLLTVPVWAATFFVSLLMTWTAGRTGDRSVHIMCLLVVAAVGNAVVTGTTTTGPRFFAMFLMPMGAVPAYQIILSWVSNSFLRPLPKRAACIAICNMIANTGSIYASYMYPSKDGPRYIPGGAANAGVCILVAILAFVLRLVHKHENRKLDRAEHEAYHGVHVAEGEPEELVKGFRYVY